MILKHQLISKNEKSHLKSSNSLKIDSFLADTISELTRKIHKILYN